MEPSSPDAAQLLNFNPRATIEGSIRVRQTILQVVHGDLTEENTDAITNAANEGLWLGGGVAGAIDRVGGPAIGRECMEYVGRHGDLQIGGVAVTGAGRMSCRHVIHAVGPVYSTTSKDNHELLESTILNIFKAAEDCELASVSIPGISSGIFGFPKDECADVMIAAFIKHLRARPQTSLQHVRYINFDMATVTYFEEGFDRARNALEALDKEKLEGGNEERKEELEGRNEDRKEGLTVSSQGTVPVPGSPEISGFNPQSPQADSEASQSEHSSVVQAKPQDSPSLTQDQPDASSSP